MAQKLHDTYGFSYDNLKVLLGGWNTWNQQHATDANGYPTDTGVGTGPGETETSVPTKGADTGNPVQLQPAPANTPAP